MSSAVLDASAALAVIDQEAGGQQVAAAMRAGATMSSVNLAEVVSKLAERGGTPEQIEHALVVLVVDIAPFDTAAAIASGLLRPLTRHLGLGLGDRACLALGKRLNLPVLTVDRAWLQLQIGVSIRAIR